MRKLFFLLFVCSILVGIWFWWSLRPINLGSKQGILVKIDVGDSLPKIANKLEEAGLIRSATAFKIAARMSGAATKLKAGTFGLTKGHSLRDIVKILVEGKTEEIQVTIPEGFNVSDIDALLVSKGIGESGDVIDCAFTCDFSLFTFLPPKAAGTRSEKIGSRLEGYLFPETYAVLASEYDPKVFLGMMLAEFEDRIVNGYSKDIASSKRSLKDLMIMSSLVEEESRRGEERAVVAGILWKRLDNSVVLGVDATTRYELKKKTAALTRTELETESPYNTRRVGGLPPSAIANAGESSFNAALHPRESEYWYYLHGSDGAIHYAVTNDDHNANKAKYLR